MPYSVYYKELIIYVTALHIYSTYSLIFWGIFMSIATSSTGSIDQKAG